MDALERLAIERECERLVADYCLFVDHDDAARVADLFAENGVWKSPEATYEGRAQIRRAFAARQAQRGRISRHVCTNLRLHVRDANAVDGVVYLTLWRHDGDEGRRVAPLEQPAMVGEYRDEFVRTPDGWRFARREVEVSFARRPA